MTKRLAQALRVTIFLILLAFTWLFWSGLFQPLLLALGALSCLLTCYVAQRMHYFDDETFALRFSPTFVAYLGWLAKEVLRSSLEVSRVVLDPRLPISPRVVEIDAGALHAVDQAILGNSITLTPGTLAIDVHRGIIQVHCLTKEGAQSLVSSDISGRVAALRKG
ncbi:MAG: Na+/H+ antiporter subunit E [Proteobacteria bacterium]|nr:Na+/H+ antiporter subunit E [Pseudomonadota bacterium]